MLGSALLCSPWLSSFRYTDREDSRFKFHSSKWLVGLFALVYVVMNAFVLILSWFPLNERKMLHTSTPVLPYFTGSVAGMAMLAFGVLWWLLDHYLLPKLGYRFWTDEESEYSPYWRVYILRVGFYVSPGCSHLLSNTNLNCQIMRSEWLSSVNDLPACTKWSCKPGVYFYTVCIYLVQKARTRGLCFCDPVEQQA